MSHFLANIDIFDFSISRSLKHDSHFNTFCFRLKKLKVHGHSDTTKIDFDICNEYKVVPCISCDTEEEDSKTGADKAAYGLLEFERPVVIVPGCKSKYSVKIASSLNYH